MGRKFRNCVSSPQCQNSPSSALASLLNSRNSLLTVWWMTWQGSPPGTSNDALLAGRGLPLQRQLAVCPFLGQHPRSSGVALDPIPLVPSLVSSCGFYWSPGHAHSPLHFCHCSHPGPMTSTQDEEHRLLKVSRPQSPLLQEVSARVVLCPQNLKYITWSPHSNRPFQPTQRPTEVFAFFDVLLHLSFTSFFWQANCKNHLF